MLKGSALTGGCQPCELTQKGTWHHSEQHRTSSTQESKASCRRPVKGPQVAGGGRQIPCGFVRSVCMRMRPELHVGFCCWGTRMLLQALKGSRSMGTKEYLLGGAHGRVRVEVGGHVGGPAPPAAGAQLQLRSLRITTRSLVDRRVAVDTAPVRCPQLRPLAEKSLNRRQLEAADSSSLFQPPAREAY